MYIGLLMTRFFYNIIIALSLLGALRTPAMAVELDQIVQVVLKKGWRKRKWRPHRGPTNNTSTRLENVLAPARRHRDTTKI